MEEISQKWFQWCSDNPRYMPYNLVCLGKPYSSIVSDLITSFKYDMPQRSEEWKVRLLTRMYQEDIRTLETSRGITTIDKTHKFVTINFDHQKFNLRAFNELIEQLKTGYDWIQSFQGVFETNRIKDGKIFNHPHFHMIIKVGNDSRYGKPLSRTVLIERLYAVKAIKKIVGGKNFIDVDPFAPRHYDYIRGVKKEEKMPCVLLDKEYRDEHNIPHLIEKK